MLKQKHEHPFVDSCFLWQLLSKHAWKYSRSDGCSPIRIHLIGW